MAEVEIDNLTSIGVIHDEPGYQIPPEGWTLGLNVRYIANGVEQLPGWSGTLGTNPRVMPPPAAPTLGSVASGALAATTYFVVITYTNANGETLASTEASLAVAVNRVLTVTSPPASFSATGWNVYISNTAGGGSGHETKQNATPIAIGTTFQEPNTGLVVGASPPAVNTASDGPLYIMYLTSAAQNWWLWASSTRIYAFDGAQDNDITRQTAGADVPYAVSDAKNLNGTIFQGVPIINNGNDPPQFWATYSAITKMAAVTNFPANLTTRVIRSFLSYLFILNNTATGTNLPHQIRWSCAAVPGSLPVTWDFTDPTNDAGSTDLPDVQSGKIVDGQELQGQFFIYKETSVWRCQFIGSPFVFSFHSFLETAGALCTRAVAMTADGLRHVIATQDDIIEHNGMMTQSLLSKKMRRYLFNRIDVSAFDTSFMFNDPVYDEMWFCYPSTGQSEPDSALIWNYKDNTISEADGIDFRACEIGNITGTGLRLWSQATFPWSADTGRWATTLRRRNVVANPNTKKLIMLDDTTTLLRDGLPFTGTVQRTGLAITGRKRDGSWIADEKNQKMVQLLWPRAQNTSGLPMQCRVGYAATLNGSVSWNPYFTFDANVNRFAEGTEGQGIAIGVEFRSQNGFRLDGYKMDITDLGEF